MLLFYVSLFVLFAIGIVTCMSCIMPGIKPNIESV